VVPRSVPGTTLYLVKDHSEQRKATACGPGCLSAPRAGLGTLRDV
jgi:hypothetical protein